jgi:hypothetical protein
MRDASLNDRRFRTWDPSLAPGARPCRLCLNVDVLESAQIETTDMHVYARCPHCGGSYPIRHSDVDALKLRALPTS